MPLVVLTGILVEFMLGITEGDAVGVFEDIANDGGLLRR